MDSIIKKAPSLYRFVALLKSRNPDDQKTLKQVKRVVADTVGVGFGGSRTLAHQFAVQSKQALFSNGNCQVWGTNEKSDLQGSIFLNTLAVSSTDFDEGHRKAAGHPASLVVPLAISLGTHLNTSYSDILKAVAIGYEAGTRYSYAREPEKVESYSSGRWGGIASAASAACLLKLNTEEFMHALSLAFILSPGMQGGSTDVSTGAMSKEGVAWASQAGLQSALLAKQGFTGPYLFIDAYEEISVTRLLEDEKEGCLINSNYFKPFACCRWLHTAIDLSLKLKKENNFGVIDIDSIEVEVFSRAIKLISYKYPGNAIEAQFHLPFTIASALHFNELLPESLNEEGLSNQDIRTLMDKIKLTPQKRFDDIFPSKLGSRVTIRLKNGTSFAKESTEAPWDASNPPTDEELFDKFKSQVGDTSNKLWNKYIN